MKEKTHDMVKQQIGEIILETKLRRIIATEGGRLKLKRNYFQSLDERGLLTPDFITGEFNRIQQKISLLGRGERDIVVEIYLLAVRSVVQTIEQMQDEEKTDNKPRTSRKKKQDKEQTKKKKTRKEQ